MEAAEAMEAPVSDVPQGGTEGGTTTAPQTADKKIGEMKDGEVKVAGEEKPPEKKKYKLKVYDKEEEVDEDEIVRRAQRASAADKKFQEAAQTEKRFGELVEKLKANPWELWKALGHDPHEAAEQLLIEKLKIEHMSPDQRRAWELEQEVQNLKSEAQRAEEARKLEQERLEADQRNELTSKAVEEIDKGIVEAIQKAGLKKASPSIIRRVAQKMLAYHVKNDGALLEADRALKTVLDELQSEWMDALETLPESEYDTRLPKGFTENLRKHLLSRVDAKGLQPRSVSKENTTPTQSGRRLKSSTDDFFKKMEQRFK